MANRAAARIEVVGGGAARSAREEIRAHARALSLNGWIRLDAAASEDASADASHDAAADASDDASDDASGNAADAHAAAGKLLIHAEGAPEALAALVAALRSRHDMTDVTERPVRPEGHEQFAIRGIPAGVFVVQEHQATAHHYDFRLEVDGVMRSWAVPKGPSLDPAVKRFAVQVEDHSLAHNAFEGPAGRGGVIIWDRGTYEQGGRVPWPEALERGHAVFVLHGEKLHGGFALQRTRAGDKPQWLLIKRRDEHARPGSDIVAEQPESVQSGRPLGAMLDL